MIADMTLIASLALGLLFVSGPAPVPAPPRSVTAARSAAKPDVMVRDLISFLNAGLFKGATRNFSDALAAVVTPEILAGQKTAIDAQAGKFQAFLETQHLRGADNAQVVQVICQHEKGQVAYRAVFDGAGRINAIFIDPVKVGVDPELEAASRAFVANLVDRKFEEATKSFDAAMKQQLPPSTLAQLVATMQMRFGKWKSISGVSQRIVDNDMRAVSVLNDYEKGRVELKLVYDKAGAVAGLTMGPVQQQ